jgi:homoserine kinase
MTKGDFPLIVPQFEITLPATSANLGPAFDSAAMAVQLFLRVRAAAVGQFAITATGRDQKTCGRLEGNLLISTYSEILRAEGKDPVPLAISIDNEIPVGKGLGSSASARLAGIALAVQFGDLQWPDTRIVAEAARREGHADNVAACWYGGVVLVYSALNGGGTPHLETLQLKTRNRSPLLLAIPEDALSTARARAVLPAQYTRADVVATVQRAMLLTAALEQGRPDLLRDAMKDCIHEPYRKSLCALLAPLQSMTGTAGIVGAALSGAGPSVLMMLDPDLSPELARDAVARLLRARRISAELIVTRLAIRGARRRIRQLRPVARAPRSKQ